MQLKKIKIGELTADNNLFLAPLAGYTNAVFRRMCLNLGASVAFTEMISAKGLYYNNDKTRELTKSFASDEKIEGCQLFGSDPKIMRAACESEELDKFDLIDINMGCPMPKIYNNGEGSALLNDFNLAKAIISECKKSGKTISVKYRIGLTKDKIIAKEFAKLCEGAGADLITIHGRTKDTIYSGEVDFKAIEEAKRAVNIPVIANGGVFGVEDAKMLLEKTGADGITVARGAMYNPFIFAELTNKRAENKKETILNQLKDTVRVYGERFACVYMRKMIGFYLHGMPDAAKYRALLFSAQTTSEVEQIFDSIDLI